MTSANISQGLLSHCLPPWPLVAQPPRQPVKLWFCECRFFTSKKRGNVHLEEFHSQGGKRARRAQCKGNPAIFNLPWGHGSLSLLNSASSTGAHRGFLAQLYISDDYHFRYTSGSPNFTDHSVCKMLLVSFTESW